jgi:hypothetical protein
MLHVCLSMSSSGIEMYVIVKKSFLVSSFDIVTLYCERSKFSWLILSTIMVIVLWIIQFHDCA